jgi:hypothetical protein
LSKAGPEKNHDELTGEELWETWIKTYGDGRMDRLLGLLHCLLQGLAAVITARNGSGEGAAAADITRLQYGVKRLIAVRPGVSEIHVGLLPRRSSH